MKNLDFVKGRVWTKRARAIEYNKFIRLTPYNILHGQITNALSLEKGVFLDSVCHNRPAWPCNKQLIRKTGGQFITHDGQNGLLKQELKTLCLPWMSTAIKSPQEECFCSPHRAQCAVWLWSSSFDTCRLHTLQKAHSTTYSHTWIISQENKNTTIEHYWTINVPKCSTLEKMWTSWMSRIQIYFYNNCMRSYCVECVPLFACN